MIINVIEKEKDIEQLKKMLIYLIECQANISGGSAELFDDQGREMEEEFLVEIWSDLRDGKRVVK